MSTKKKQHEWYIPSLKRFNYPVCDKCGLIYLKNEATKRKANKPCPGHEEDNCG